MKKLLLLVFSLIMLSLTAKAQTEFITTWQTTDGTITIPINDESGTLTYNYDITWTNLDNSGVGDGSASGQTGDYTITGLANGDTYQIEIVGDFPRIFFNTSGDKDKILTIQQWGAIQWASMEKSFWGCSNLTYSATDSPELSMVTSLASMFASCGQFNGDISNWDVGNIETMERMFHIAQSFNQDISQWNTSSLLNTQEMFYAARKFNQPLDAWDVSKVTNMREMFRGAWDFNQDLNSWDLTSLTENYQMFRDARSFNGNISNWTFPNLNFLGNLFLDAINFNQDISGWDVSQVTSMNQMFSGARSFNQPIGSWIVSNVVSMRKMFDFASAFNQDLSNWDISGVTDMSSMFDDTNMSVNNYDVILQGWAAQTVQSGVILGSSGLSYCNGELARNTLISKGWTINGDTKSCIVNIPDSNFKTALLADNTINTNSDTEIQITEANSYVGELIIQSANIADLTGIEAFTQITGVNFYNNNLTDVDLSENTFLESIQLPQNALTSLVLPSGTTLKTLRLFFNETLTSIDVSDATGLEVLNLNGCSVSSIDVANLTQLKDLQLQNNNLTSLDVSQNVMLTQLAVALNDLSAIDLSSLSLLEKLYINENINLSQLDLSNNNNLSFITAQNMSLLNSELILPSSAPIVTLYIQGNNLQELNLSNYGLIEELSVANNNLTVLNIKNGNNNALTFFDATNNPDLNCILVDDATFFESNFTSSIDGQTSYTTSVCNAKPTAINLASNTFDENNAEGDVIGTLSTIDQDAGDMHTYSLVSGTGDSDNTSFTISGSDLLAAEVFDFETKSSYSIRVQTNDGNGGTLEETFTIMVTDVNEVPTAIALSSSSIDENNAVGDVIGSFSTTDPDAGDTHTYSLVAGTGDADNASFTISGMDLQAAEAFDFETKASYSVRVATTDAGGLSFEQEITISINDVNEQEAQTITFNAIADQFLEEVSLTLTATASSGLVVEYAITSGPATLSADVITFTGVGSVTVEATQPGNTNYLAADPVTQTFEIVSVTSTPEVTLTNLRLYPNPSSETLNVVNIDQQVQQIEVLDTKGQRIYQMENPSDEEQINITNWKEGIYMVIVRSATDQQVIKFIKQ